MEIAKVTLKELEEEGIKEVADNLKRPGGRMKNPDSRADKNHATIPQTLLLFGTRTQKRLFKAYKLMRNYKM
eukprot:536115-Ditylum_brightwellii.AAC.1